MNNWKLRHSFTGNATSDVQTVNGYLADPAFSLHTNLVDYSEGLSAFAGGVTTTLATSEVDPTGNSGTVVETSNFQGAVGDRQQLNIVEIDEANRGKDFTGSLYVKGTSGETITYRIKRRDPAATFVGSAEVQLTFDGTWQRIEATMTSLADTLDCSLYLINKAADTADTFLVWGGQIEQDDAASPYIKTDGAPVTLPDTFNVTVVPDGKEYAAPLFIPRTNLLPQSNQFDTDWTSVNTTETGGQAGYDGTSDGWLLAKIAANGETRQTVDAGLRTFSIYAKAGSLSWMYLLKGGNAGQYFNLGTGVLGSPTGVGGNVPLDAKIEDVGGGWYRCCMTYNDLYPGSLRIYPADGDNDTSGTSGNIYIQDAQLEVGSVATEYIPTTTAAVTRDWSAFGRVQNQVPGICNGTHTHTGAASGSGIAATTITGSGSGATFAYDFDTLGVLTTLTADGAGSGYKVGDKLSIDTTEGHTIEFRLVEGSNAATVSVSMGATRPTKPIPFPVSKMRVEGLTDRTVLFLDKRSQYVFPKPTPYLLDTYEGAAAAYSLRRLRSAYTGPAVRVRRASNNDELDIYFNRDGSLDTATLEAFCAGTDGFVKVWFDQGQGGNDAEQTSTASQPQIVSSGSVVTENGEPALDFDGANDYFTKAFTLGNPVSHFVVAQTASINDFIIDGYDAVNLNSLVSPSTNVMRLYNGTGILQTYTAGTQSLFSSISKGAGSLFAVNGNSTTQTISTNSMNGMTLGAAGTLASGFNLNGTIQEVIIYGSDQDSNRTGIESNINDFYSIYP